MKKVLYIQPVHESGMNRLAKNYEVVVAPDPSRATIERLIVDADAIITRLTTIDKELIGKGLKLKAIGRHGIGVDNIDVGYATEKNVAVLTTGDANSISVAEHVIFAVGALSKKIHWLDRQMRSGNWASRDRTGAGEITGKILGIVGLGNIGTHIARIAKYGFNMKVMFHDPFASKEALDAAGSHGYERCEALDDLVKSVDVLTVHVPLTPHTTNLIDERRLELMKPTAFVVNFARGGIVNEAALYQALANGKLAGAALDVYEQEPPDYSSPLMQLDNVILSPHCAYYTEDSRVRMSLQLAEGIEEVLEGKRPRFAANLYNSSEF
jgi:D-3-phosphoglycerate dehydrogenase